MDELNDRRNDTELPTNLKGRAVNVLERWGKRSETDRYPCLNSSGLKIASTIYDRLVMEVIGEKPRG